jgi:hypothetical protein
METGLLTRLVKIRETIEEFNLDQQKIADYSERNRVTVSRVLGGKDERYVTETNVEAIEKGIEKLLDEYRKKLCK